MIQITRTQKRSVTRVDVVASLPIAILVLIYALVFARRVGHSGVSLSAHGFRYVLVTWWEPVK